MDLSGLRDAVACNALVEERVPVDHHDLVERIREDTRGAQAGHTCADHNRVPPSIRNLLTIVLWSRR
jgi:hypothetical protein